MIVDINKKILIVGLGLLGGSYAKVLKRFGFHISSITLEQSSIDYAVREGLIDEGSTELDEKMIGDADLVIFALYPHVFVEWIEKNQHLLKSGALITEGCALMLHLEDKLVKVDGTYYEDEHIWQFTVSAKATEGYTGRFWYCFMENGKNLCFKEPIYLV